MAKEKDDSKKTFEELLGELEQLAQDMEQRELPLDDALVKFERGIALSRACKARLGAAQTKIQQLTKDNQLEDFEPAAE